MGPEFDFALDTQIGSASALRIRGSDISLPKFKCHFLIGYYATLNKLLVTSSPSFENEALLEPITGSERICMAMQTT